MADDFLESISEPFGMTEEHNDNVSTEVVSETYRYPSVNVVGTIEGTDPKLKNEYVHDTISLYGVTEDEIKALKTEYKAIRDGYRIQVKNTLEATKMIVKHQEIFRDYEVVKGGMDDVFLAVTGKILGGGQ